MEYAETDVTQARRRSGTSSDISAESNLAAAMVGYAVEILLGEDRSEYHTHLENVGVNVHSRNVGSVNAWLASQGEDPVNTIPSLHAAELRWLNGCLECRVPVALCASLLGVSAQEIRDLVAKRVRTVLVGPDGLLSLRSASA